MVLDGDPTGRRARWALEIDLYDWIIEYRHGHKHVNADAMSRRPDRNGSIPDEIKPVNFVSASTQTEKFIVAGFVFDVYL
ncbi:tetratricopeptide repeat 27-like protein [Labeo rohita]|uniref:Tetratricopeptide repeat 27-like protein n=1 Tax=Labeo rohita TaxID=84645 RepID=A0A498NWA8_LABRO|nr:tetratricopeptide repeat 27-like protein [Labeo rohita]